ncbi:MULTISPECIES: hypothetical protein [unclassified Actinomyces]|uniref:hypothetical protein n=1 Tax=unclassified Actinomyces TaxID=2609248 RepID=UPI0020174DB6|nr:MULTISPECIES: hypothetical protein [unclassified Actinomyces]MCL3776755.1 hypothetical protein [Actinomyces sp. AC-20-1]MCL3789709.1 hypothetical protein [Actinomyces sp. 187325]MCL3791894.1 hypothetical protein [Actinomyces sp. 186855]MCL3794445.1 hypothetical protein [Actinomyces sp. 217892]
MLVFATGAARALRNGDGADAGAAARSEQSALVNLVRRNTVLAAFLFLAGGVGRSYGWLREPGFDPRVLFEVLGISVWFAVEWAMSSDARRGE